MRSTLKSWIEKQGVSPGTATNYIRFLGKFLQAHLKRTVDEGRG